MTTTRYLWNPINQNIIREYDGAGSTVASYTTEPDLYGDVVSQHRDGQDSYYHTDGQGSTLALTDSNGDMTDRYAYSAFGEVTEHTGSTVNPFQYIGCKGYYADDQTAAYEIRRRPHESILARWLSPDPLQSENLSLNAFMYVANMPMTAYDPSGLKECVVKRPGIKITKQPIQGEYDKDHLDGFWGRRFEAHVEFDGECCCCEFRQSVMGTGVRGRYIPGDGSWQYGDNGWLPKPAPGAETWREDCVGKSLVPNVTPPWSPFPVQIVGIPFVVSGCYGHRNDHFNQAADTYSAPNVRETGCVYDNHDWPGQPGINTVRRASPRKSVELELNLSFLLQVVDVCNLDEQGKPKETAKEQFAFVGRIKLPPIE